MVDLLQDIHFSMGVTTLDGHLSCFEVYVKLNSYIFGLKEASMLLLHPSSAKKLIFGQD